MLRFPACNKASRRARATYRDLSESRISRSSSTSSGTAVAAGAGGGALSLLRPLIAMLRLGGCSTNQPLDQLWRIERIVIHCYDGTVGEVAKCVDALGVRAYVGNEADLQPLAPLSPERERYVG